MEFFISLSFQAIFYHSVLKISETWDLKNRFRKVEEKSKARKVEDILRKKVYVVSSYNSNNMKSPSKMQFFYILTPYRQARKGYRQ